MAEQSLMGIAIAQDNKIQYINQAYVDIFGYTIEELMNWELRDAFNAIDPDDREFALEQLAKKQRGDKDGIEHYQYRGIKKSGKIIWVEQYSKPITYRGKPANLVTLINITERKKAEQKLKESEEKFRNLSTEYELILDNFPGLIFSKDTKNNFIQVNRNVVASYNRDLQCKEKLSSKKDLEGRNLFDILPRDIAQAYWDEDLEVIRSGLPKLNIEESWESEDGTNWINTSKIPFTDENGNVKGVVGISMDITESKKAEQELEESEKRFKDERDNLLNMLNSMEDGVYIINQQYEIEFVNPSLKNVFGPIGNKKCHEYFQGISKPCPWCKTQENIIQGSIRWEWDSPITNKFYEIIATPIKRADGNISKLVIFHDITKRKKAGDKIKRAREQADMYLDLAGVILVALNKDGIITLMNKKGYKILEYEEGELIGDNWFEKCLPKKDKDDVFEIYTGLMNGDSESFEYVEGNVMTKTGKNKRVVWHNIVLYDKNGKINGTLSSGEDITERKKVEKELNKLTKLKSELLTRTSHELKTPAMHIKGYADLLLHKHKVNLGIEQLQIISHIKKGVLRLETLIYDILHKAELDSGHGELNKVKDNLSSLIDLSVRELNSFAALRGHSIILDIHDSMITIFDKDQMRHVINNLITNAIKYTPLNGIIGINSIITDDFITVAVQDNGIGLTEEQINRLFTQFGKIERYGQGFDIITDGSGLGLHIAKKIIDLHDGKIWVESGGRNKGSTFYFSLPRNIDLKNSI